MSLGTRCPKEALRLAKILEYHSAHILQKMDFTHMTYAEILSILKQHFKRVLESAQRLIDTEGTFTKEKVEHLTAHIESLDSMDDKGHLDELDALGIERTPEESLFFDEIQKIIKENDLSMPTDSKEYRLLEKQYVAARRNHFRDVLAYNNSQKDYSLLTEITNSPQTTAAITNKKHSLNTVLEAYIKEISDTLKGRSLKDLEGVMRFLQDYLGEEYNIIEVTGDTAREFKNILTKTPKSRNKAKATAGKPLTEQIKIAQQEKLPLMSPTTINKYLIYTSSFFNWAKNNKYIEHNHFKDLNIKASKERRIPIKAKDIQLILKGLSNNSIKSVTNESQYWAAMILIYTGARSGEIASLRVSDIKQAPDSKIWYFDINDNDETKSLKNARSARQIPIHSALLKKGIIEYRDKIQDMIDNKPWPQKDIEPRLLYDLRYSTHHNWTRKIGVFMKKLLIELDLHAKNKIVGHSLRHSFMTYLKAQVDVDSASVTRMTGHSNTEVHEAQYTHHDLSFLPKLQRTIEKLPY